MSHKKDAFIKEFTPLESSQYAQTLGAEVSISEAKNPADWVIDPIYSKNPMKKQLAEVSGRCLNDSSHVYHTDHYKSLLQTVVPLRKSFRAEKDYSVRKQIAKSEFDAWNTYLTQRKQDMVETKTEDQKTDEEWRTSRSHFSSSIDNKEFGLLKEFFDRFKVSSI